MFQQLLFPKSIGTINVHVSFSQPTLASGLSQADLMPAVIALARQALTEHMLWIK
jgi:hypothetical protein